MTNYYLNSGGSNTAPYDTWAKGANLQTTLGAVPWTNADSVYVSDTHSESTAGTLTLGFPTSAGLKFVGSDDATGEPPTTTSTTAVIANTTNAPVNFTGFAYVFGIIFSTQAANNGLADFVIPSGNTATGLVFDTCKFRENSTNALALTSVGQQVASTNDDCMVEFIDTSFKFGATGQYIELRHGRLRWRGMTLEAGGSAPTTLFKPVAANTYDVRVDASDLTGVAWTNLIDISLACSGRIVFANCKMTSGWVATTGTNPGPGGVDVIIDNCDDADTNYTFLWSMGNLGTIIEETTVVRTSGATDGNTAFSWEMGSSANVKLWHPLTSPKPICKWIDNTVLATLGKSLGSSITATIECVNDGVTFNNDELWSRAEFLGTSGFPVGSFDLDTRVASVLATPAAQTSSSVAWTTTGLASPVKQKLVHTFTPNEYGYLMIWPCLSKASSTVFVDPLITLA